MEFVERSLEYYESWFGCHIIRAPNPALYRMLNGLVWQTPERCDFIERCQLPLFSRDDVFRLVAEDLGIPAPPWVAVGIRGADNPFRAHAIRRTGCVNEKRHTFYPIADWKQADLVAAFRDAGVRLPVDYLMFGRSFDGLAYEYLEPIMRWFPADYQRILDLFPMADSEIYRHEVLQHG